VLDAEGLELQVTPLMGAVPIGAPVRVNFELVNRSQDIKEVPASLSLKRGHVKGQVVAPSGVVRTFRPIVICVDEGDERRLLKPGETMSHSATLLRGAQGALFAAPGVHQVIVEVSWHVGEVEMRVAGETAVMITAAVDTAHAEASLSVLSCPDLLLTLAIGGDHLDHGIAALHVAMNNPILRPHYAIVEAKRVGRRFGKRKPDLETARKLLDDAAVLSPAEIKRAAELFQGAQKATKDESYKTLTKCLIEKARKVGADHATVTMVERLAA
jgi:hypothetical protein